MRRLLLGTGIVLACVGCGSGSSLMPLSVGRTWSFTVKAGLNSYNAEVKVTRETSVASAKGYEISGPLGTSRMAWNKSGLVADQLVNAQFIPALPLLAEGEESKPRKWHGRVILVDNASPASGVQSQAADDTQTYQGSKVHTVRSTVLVKTAERNIELITWYLAGVGPIRQEQRTNGTLVVALSSLGEK